VCCNGVIIGILQLYDGGTPDFTFGFKPVEIEEPALSPLKDWDPLW